MVEFVPLADVAQLAERQLPKLEVAGSTPVVRSLSYIAHPNSALPFKVT